MPHIVIRRNVKDADEPLFVQMFPSDNSTIKEVITRFERERRIVVADEGGPGSWKAGGFNIAEMLDTLESYGFKLLHTIPGEKINEYVLHKAPGVFESLHG